MNNHVNKLIVSIFMLALLCSCYSQEGLEAVHSLPISDTLHAQVVHLNQINLLNPRHIYTVNDKYLVIMDQTKTGIFKVFSLLDLNFLYSWGRHGKGPHEFIDSRGGFVRDDKLILYHRILNKLVFYHITDTAFVIKRKLELSYPVIPGAFMEMRGHLKMANDSLFYSAEWSPHQKKKEYIAFAPPDTLLFKFGIYPKTNLKGKEQYKHFRKIGAFKPDGSRYIAFYMKYNRFKIYNSHGGLLMDVNIDDPFISNNSAIKHFTRFQLRATDNFIYYES